MFVSSQYKQYCVSGVCVVDVVDVVEDVVDVDVDVVELVVEVVVGCIVLVDVDVEVDIDDVLVVEVVEQAGFKGRKKFEQSLQL